MDTLEELNQKLNRLKFYLSMADDHPRYMPFKNDYELMIEACENMIRAATPKPIYISSQQSALQSRSKKLRK